MTSEAKGTIASRLPKGRLTKLLTNEIFLKEVIRCNVSIRLMMVADMYPKNYINRQVLTKELEATWEIIPIDFDHAFLPQTLKESRLIIPDWDKPLTPENNLVDDALKEMYSEKAIQVLI